MIALRRVGCVSGFVFLSGWQLCLAAVTVTLDVPSATLRVTKGQKFTATVAGNANHAVSWTVNGVAGGNTTVGTVSTSGQYTAPAVVPSPNLVTVQATSAVDATASGSGTVTLQNPVPALYGVSPSSVNQNLAFKLTVSGANFVTGAKVLLNGSAMPTTVVSSTQLTATGLSSAAPDTLLSITV